MTLLRSAVATVVGLFVSDWRETLAIVLILALAFLLGRRAAAPWLGFGLGAALALNLVVGTRAEARRRRAGAARPAGDQP